MTKLSDRLEALAEKASEGPWRWEVDTYFQTIWGKDQMVTYYTTNDDGVHFASDTDPHLIVELVNNLPTILQALKDKEL